MKPGWRTPRRGGPEPVTLARTLRGEKCLGVQLQALGNERELRKEKEFLAVT